MFLHVLFISIPILNPIKLNNKMNTIFPKKIANSGFKVNNIETFLLTILKTFSTLYYSNKMMKFFKKASN